VASSNSRQPDPDGCEEYEAQVVGGGLLVSGSDTTVPLELTEEGLDKVALLVEMQVDLAPLRAVRLRGDDRDHLLLFDPRDDVVGVVRFVSDEVLALRFLDENSGFGDVVDVAGRDVDVERITETVNESVDFGGKASARASNTLSVGPPFPPEAS
jgi:hypothetical protein